jgi:hypothetical protein
MQWIFVLGCMRVSFDDRAHHNALAQDGRAPCDQMNFITSFVEDSASYIFQVHSYER